MRHSTCVLAIVVVTGLVFANALRNGFHLDDFYRIRDNPEIRHVAPVWRHFVDPGTISGSQGTSESRLHQFAQYRPLLPLSLSLNYWIGEHSFVGYHLGNLVFQIVASVLLYFLVLELLRYGAGLPIDGERGRWLALIVAVVFAIHPVSGIPVNYILARDLLLMEVFLIASLLAYLRLRREGATIWRWGGVLALFVLAILSKTTAAMAPLVVLVFELTVGGGSVREAAPWRRALPFVAVTLMFFGVSYLTLDFSGLARVQERGLALDWRYPLTEGKVHLFHYLSNFAWPFPIRQAPYVEPARGLTDGRVLLGLAVIGSSLAAAWGLRRRAPLAAFCILAYWILMIPESSILSHHHPVVHYRAYASSPFLYLVIGLAAERFLPPRAALLLGGAAVVYFAFASVHLNRTWRTEETLWTHSVHHGAEPLAHMNLAMSIADRSDPRVRRHLEEAVRRAPYYILAHINLGLLDIHEGRQEAGLERIRRAVEMDPSLGQSHYWLSLAYSGVGQREKAAEASARAAGLDPKNLPYLYKAGLDASEVGKYAEALDYVRRIEGIEADFEETGFLKGFALEMLGRLDESVAAYGEFLERHPDHAQVQFNLGYVLMSVGRCGDAVPHFEAVLRLRPEHAEARRHLEACSRPGADQGSTGGDLASLYGTAMAAYRAGDYARSLALVREIEAIRPDYEETQFLKGFDLQMLGRLDEANETYRRILARDPNHWQVQFNLAYALMSAGNCREAIPHFEKALALKPDYAQVHLHLSTCYAEIGDPQAAAHHLERYQTPR